jgi:VCBS repeat protein
MGGRMGGSRRVAALAAAAAAAGLLGAPAAGAEIAFGPAEDRTAFAVPIAMARINGFVAVLAREPVPSVSVPSGPGLLPRVAVLVGGSVPEAMAGADLEGDGFDEVVVVSSGTNVVSVIKNLGAPTDFASGQVPTGMTIGDFTGDHNADVAVVGDLGITLLRGDGAGGLAPAQLTPSGSGAQGGQVVSGDFDGDGRRDIVAQVSRECAGRFGFPQVTRNPTLFLGDGAGGFAAPRDLVAGCVQIGRQFLRMAAADLSGDGNLDLAFNSIHSVPGDPSQYARAEVMLGTGGGLFADAVALGEPRAPVAPAGPYPAVGVALGDLDADGRQDLIVPRAAFAGGATPALAVLRNLGGGAFGSLRELPVPTETGLVVPMEVNGDGALDLVLGRGAALGTIAVLHAVPLPAGQGAYFGQAEVGRSGPLQPVRVENRGAAPLGVSAIALEGGAAGDFLLVEDECTGRTLSSGGRCTVRARFRPTAVGSRNAEAIVSASSPVAPLRLALDGLGVAAPAPPPPEPTGPPAARAGCATRWAGARPSVTCGVVLSRSAPAVRVELRLVRGGRTWARATAARGGRLTLRPLRPLTAGSYALVVLVREGALTRQSRASYTLRASARRQALRP